MDPLRLLFVEDSPEDVELIAAGLESEGFPPGHRLQVRTPESLRRALASGPWDLVIGDYSLADFEELAAVAMVREADPDLPFLMISGMAGGNAGVDAAVSAMKAGAADFLIRSDLRRLGPTVARVLRERRVREESRKAEQALREGEARLREAQRMESVGRLAGGIAHDFNNILSVVSGYANLLQIKLGRAGAAPKELVEIERAVVRATDLVNQLLAFSRRQPTRRQVLDLGRLLGDTLPGLAMMLGGDVRVETDLEPGKAWVRADRCQLERAILNLATNARDAMPGGGRLRIGLARLVLGPDHFREGEEAAPGPHVRLTFQDEGTGMDEETQSRIFEPFFTTKGGSRGSGLGLSAVYGIIRGSGGTIRVDSRPFGGSEFSLYLPEAPAPQEAPEAEGPDCPPCRKSGAEAILLVEDDAELRSLTKDALVMDGYKVLEARTVEEAMGFALSRELPIDLLLTDIDMPVRNGRDLADAVLILRPGLKVMFMSGFAAESLNPDGGRTGTGFLEKPFTAGRLLERVRAALDAPRAEKQL